MKKIISFFFLIFLFSLSLNAQTNVKSAEYARPETTVVGFETKDRFHYMEFCRNINSPLTSNTGNNVKILQTILRYQVYPSLQSTGYYGSLTKRAVQIFQQTHGIRQTGFVGPITLAKMREVWCNFNYTYEAELPPPPAPIKATISTFNATPKTIEPGESVVLTWSSTNATKCNITSSKGESMTVLPSGTKTFNPTSNITYILTCSNSTGSSDPSSQSISVGFPPATISVTPITTTITQGSPINLNLSTTNMTSCRLNGGSFNNNNININGITPTIPTVSTTYTVNCVGKDGQAYTAQSLINVTELPKPVLMQAPTFSPPGGIYTKAQRVTLFSSDATSIRYTVNGLNPTCSTGNNYIGPFDVAANQIVKAISCKGTNYSDIANAEYAINIPVVVVPSVPLPGTPVITYSVSSKTTQVCVVPHQSGYGCNQYQTQTVPVLNITVTSANATGIGIAVNGGYATCTPGTHPNGTDTYSVEIKQRINGIAAVGCNSAGQSNGASATYDAYSVWRW